MLGFQPSAAGKKRAWLGFVWLLALLAGATPAAAQFRLAPGDLSDVVHVDEADAAVRAAFDRVKAYVAEKQWDDAVESLRKISESSGGKLIRLDERRYLPLRDYCQLQLAGLPPEGLKLYRSRVDPLAKKWCDEGIAARNAELLGNVAGQMFASSYGDKALYALGEIALERGDYNAARGAWESIGRGLKTPDGRPLWSDPDSKAPAAPWLAYPDTDLNLADVRARLVLVSILEGDRKRAAAELAAFARLHPDAQGRMAGVDANYVATLTALAAAAKTWPEPAATADWPTFAGDPCRTRLAQGTVEIGLPAWEPIGLGPPRAGGGGHGFRVAENWDDLLSYHPLVVGQRLLFNDERRVYAFDLATGQPAWPAKRGGKAPTATELERRPGEIYRIDDARRGATLGGERGVPRFTLTAFDHKLLARLGSPVTVRAAENMFPAAPGEVVCLDLDQSGKLLWKLRPENDHWAFEGTPLSDGANVYVAMRYADVRPQLHVAAFDAATGEPRWRRLIAAAETPAKGTADEISHTLVTLDHDMLYVNTNLGAVAALSTAGQLKWVSRYPRSSREDTQFYTFRDLTPCIAARGLIFAAPSDSLPIYAFDALTGQQVWKSAWPNDAIHLLGVSQGTLVASGNRLWLLEADSGRLVGCFPDVPQREGLGRGLLVGSKVLWPTRDRIRVFDLARLKDDGRGPTNLEMESLNLTDRAATGGNLLLAPDRLLIATGDKLFGFTPRAGGLPPEKKLTALERGKTE